MRRRSPLTRVMSPLARTVLASALPCSVCLTAPDGAAAASWVGGSGAWSDVNNWSPAGIPAPDTDVFIVHNDGLDRHITFDHDYPQPLGAFILDQTGAGTTTFSMTANTFGTNYQNIDKQEVIGLNGRATFLQSGGINMGHPTFNQIRIGEGAGSAGTYNLSGGTISAAGLFMGNAGAGTFIQTGGAASLSFAHLGSSSGSSGTMTIGGNASFFAQSIFCAQDGSGRIIQSGGEAQTWTLNMGNGDGAAAYDLSGGTFGAQRVLVGGGGLAGMLGSGVVNQSGGTATVGSLSIGWGTTTPGTWAITGGSLRVTGDFEVGRFGHGTFSMGPGAAVHFGEYLTIGHQTTGAGTFLLNGGTFTARTEDIGVFGRGTFLQSGGSHIVTTLVLGLEDASAGTYALSGGTLATANEYVGAFGVGVFDQTGGTHVVGNTIRISDSFAFGCAYNLSGGTVSANRLDNKFGTFTQTGGVATFTSGIAGFGTLHVSGTGRLHAATSEQFALSIGTGGFVACAPGGGATGGINFVRRFALAGDATWDLGDTDLIVEYGPFPVPATVMREHIADGYDGGSWTGAGLTSSAAADAAGQPGPKTALGYADASALFSSFPAVWNGTVINEFSMLVRYTYFGDADLDGRVNLNDFNRLAANFGSTGAFWDDGDFNYDGLVNLADFNLLAGNFGLGASGPEVTPGDWAALASAVPEPGGVGVGLVVVGLGLAGRRRR